jgi:DNA-directed RNA polymerase subunit RPC12/RpoP
MKYLLIGGICMVAGFLIGIGTTLVWVMRIDCKYCGKRLKDTEDIYNAMCDKCWKRIHNIQKQ